HQIRILIANENNWDNILALAEVLCPIVRSTLSLVYKEMANMKDLEYNITSPIQDSVVNIISKWFNYMQTPIMLLFYFFDTCYYPHYHFRPIAYTLTQLFQKVIPYINNFVPKTKKEIHAGLYKEYKELVALFNTNITLQEAAKELHSHDCASSERNWSVYSYINTKKQNRLTNKHLEELVIHKNKDKKKNNDEGEPVWLSDIEQEVNCEETNYLF
ncbi:32333_t:CDS:2, partial [Gigaspora margarita]